MTMFTSSDDLVKCKKESDSLVNPCHHRVLVFFGSSVNTIEKSCFGDAVRD